MARDQQCVRARRVRRHRRRTLREEARNRAHVRNSARTRSLCVSHEARGLGASLPHGRHEFAPRHATSNAPERVEFAGIAGAHLREEARNRGSEKPGARPNSARTRSLCVSHEPQGLGASLPHGRHEFAVRLSLAPNPSPRHATRMAGPRTARPPISTENTSMTRSGGSWRRSTRRPRAAQATAVRQARPVPPSHPTGTMPLATSSGAVRSPSPISPPSRIKSRPRGATATPTTPTAT